MTENLRTFCLTISTVFKVVSSVPWGRRGYLVLALCVCFPFLLIAAITGTSFAQSVEWEKVDAAIGRKATVLGDVHRYGFPRSDLNVSLDDVILKPAFALGGWVAFKPMNAEVMVMGDLVLLGTEITPVMTKLIEKGIEITGRARPRVRHRTTRSNPAGPMGVATSINFQPTGGGKAAITGDFVLAANEVNPVVKALRQNEIEVTAVQPRLFFMHFWANDAAIKLAKGLRTALDQVSLAKD